MRNKKTLLVAVFVLFFAMGLSRVILADDQVDTGDYSAPLPPGSDTYGDSDYYPNPTNDTVPNSNIGSGLTQYFPTTDNGTCPAGYKDDPNDPTSCILSDPSGPSGYESCGYGYKNDPNDPSSCVPTDNCPEGYVMKGSDCVDPTGTSAYESCGYGYKNDPSDPTSCLPTDGCDDGFALKNGECVDQSGTASQCDYGYSYDPSQPASSQCIANDSCPDGSTLVNGDCTNVKGAVVKCASGLEADDGQCYGGKTAYCNEVEDTSICGANSGGANPKSSAADAKASTGAAAGKSGGGGINVAMKSGSSGAGAGSLVANKALTVAGFGKIPVGSLIDSVTGLVTSAAGAVLGTIPGKLLGSVLGSSAVSLSMGSGGFGLGISLGGASGLSGIGGMGYGGYGGATSGSCGAGFSVIGGVCFPTTTGLSSAPVQVILSNIFSWLMGLFTTLAVLAFVISGVQYLTSAGDEGQIETAKRNSQWSLIGVIVGLSGFVIVQAIATALSGQGFFF